MQSFIETSSLINQAVLDNKNTVIQDLVSSETKHANENIANSDETIAELLKKIQNDTETISNLISTRSQLLNKVKDLESQNRAISLQSIKQEIFLRSLSAKENFARKEYDNKKIFKKLNESRKYESLQQENLALKSRIEACKTETNEFKRKIEESEKTYKLLKDCLLGSEFKPKSEND